MLEHPYYAKVRRSAVLGKALKTLELRIGVRENGVLYVLYVLGQTAIFFCVLIA
jgi:hypothetical protein